MIQRHFGQASQSHSNDLRLTYEKAFDLIKLSVAKEHGHECKPNLWIKYVRCDCNFEKKFFLKQKHFSRA